MKPDQLVAITPPSLKRVFHDQRHRLPEDADALDRLFQQLELNRPLLAEIRDAVAEFYCLEQGELSKRWRIKEVVVPRQIFCYLGYRYTRFSLEYVGRFVGISNHTTVMHACRQIERLAMNRPLIADDIDVLRLKICERVLLRRRAFAC